MKLYETLEQQLKKEPNFVTDNGELKKWVVLNKAQNFDEELIALLLQEPTLKEKFFKEIAGVTVFNQNLFVQFLEQKNYLNDSYTQYKNKVGLTIDGKYLKQRNEVALVWPFKDCILEGGQSREEQKREEIFFNEILAQDEITQLLEPKVLTNAKVFDKDGEHLFDGFTRDAELNRKRGLPENTITDNLIIKGNNLLALHTLKEEFAGKVKLIYIDPPYNTGKDGFGYNDCFNHSSWLTFMVNRLKIAKEFLKQNGLIIISCDDNEIGYLRILLDEVFGKNNFILNGVVNRASEIASNFVVSKHEYFLCYAKDINRFSLGENIRYTVSRGTVGNPNQTEPIIKFPKGLKCLNVNDGTYKTTRKINGSSENIENLDDIIVENGALKNDVRLKAKWRSSNDMRNFFNNNCQPTVAKINGIIEEIYFDSDRFMPYIKKKVIEKIPSLYLDNKRGSTDLERLGMQGTFNFPKNINFIKFLSSLTTNKNDIVLDYHAGSGTTAHAVLELNKEDGGNRQFILVEQMDYIETVTRKRVQKVIEQNGNGSFVYLELKKYNQTFIEQIEEAKDTEALLQIWEQMKVKSFLNYNVDIKKQDEHLEEFKVLSLAEQKQHLCEVLDKNQLYVNRSSLNDTDFACTEEEKRLNRDFYKMK
jgi:adenine-specific DNA-methyltransferase